MTLGERITQLRKEKGWSQEDLGSQVGVSRQAVSRWESDQAVPETEKIVELSRLFGVSAGVLLGTEERTGAVIPETEPVPKPVRRKTWTSLLGGILTAMVIFGVTAHQNAQIRDLQNSLNSLQGMYRNLSYRMDRMNSDLADTIEEILSSQYTVFAEYSLAVDSIDRDAGIFRVRVNGVLRNPAESVRFFARDSKDAIYAGSIDTLDEQSGTVNGTVDVPLERGIRFYAANGTETMQMTVRNADLYDFTRLSASLESYGIEAGNKGHVVVSFYVGIPYIMDEQEKLNGVNGQLKVICGTETICEGPLTERKMDTPYPSPVPETVMSGEFDRIEPVDGLEEYLLYASITDDRGRRYDGYLTKIQIRHTGNSEMVIAVDVDPETGENR